MFNGQIINKLIEEKGVTKKSLYNFAGLSKTQLDNIISGKNIPGVDKIERIADFFEMPIDFFFNRNTNLSGINVGHQIKGNGNNISGDITLSECQTEIAHLKQLLQEKENIIKEKERTIQILMNK